MTNIYSGGIEYPDVALASYFKKLELFRNFVFLIGEEAHSEAKCHVWDFIGYFAAILEKRGFKIWFRVLH